MKMRNQQITPNVTFKQRGFKISHFPSLTMNSDSICFHSRSYDRRSIVTCMYQGSGTNKMSQHQKYSLVSLQLSISKHCLISSACHVMISQHFLWYWNTFFKFTMIRLWEKRRISNKRSVWEKYRILSRNPEFWFQRKQEVPGACAALQKEKCGYSDELWQAWCADISVNAKNIRSTRKRYSTQKQLCESFCFHCALCAWSVWGGIA